MCNMHKNKDLLLCELHKTCPLYSWRLPCMIIPEVETEHLTGIHGRGETNMFKGFFNDLVAARMMDLDSNRVKNTARKARRAVK